MQLCEEVADGLSERGHSIAVLTSTDRVGQSTERPYPVYRRLEIDPNWNSSQSAAAQFFVGRRRRERQAAQALRSLNASFRPDVVFIWHAIGLPRTLLREAEMDQRLVVAYYLANYLPESPDEYIAYWKAQSIKTSARWAKRLLSPIALRLLALEGKPVHLEYRNAICVSHYLRNRLVTQGLIPSNATVIHNGVDLAEFSPNGRQGRELPTDELRCLIAGRIAPEKGIHTAIDGLALQRDQEADIRLTLTILGDGQSEYKRQLSAVIDRHGLQDIVRFRKPVPRERMPALLEEYDALILASEWDEPLARAMQEAMAMDMLIIGTVTGGSGELLRHNETGLVFEPGNAESLAAQLQRAVNEPDHRKWLARAGRRRVMERFDVNRTIDQIEDYLFSRAGQRQRQL